jgi:hypothetical protein
MQGRIALPDDVESALPFRFYRTNPSITSSSGMPTRSRRIQVPGGKAAMIVDNCTGEIKGHYAPLLVKNHPLHRDQRSWRRCPARRGGGCFSLVSIECKITLTTD